MREKGAMREKQRRGIPRRQRGMTVQKVSALFFTVSIPVLLCAGVWQASRYQAVERVVREYDAEQHRIIAENKRKISGIAILSKPDRIEKLAVEKLHLHRASHAEIVRIKLRPAHKDSSPHASEF
ncbi:hypothetical protein TPADAL_0385 [Treponema pallidum subsp. pallidum DAL-1]|uniref:Cell division protein FtsL n=4 Tax=Treponema pallidum TaxID=160 RepID=O83400_TREPA|nr:conserved hypothetical protein [Treponema pallidum subsp. pallidum str. Nichols]ACD70811.1 hypothetical protein TPASS_0385 [Treponema pallidum subsp. pallidum SS14]AEZ57507.1 hypothetical protein TPESAMD_0385 [Treponema pallidum subsp. pertenue str. SamoaD]AEZ58576.1 hypothetical protein TPECDC2_0385 [Treponema pallidum subsp. pertenue str. CDC2]AEZ59644.1 hypothetical protein TPEGAU_0385 [Treponema pallidum subsp. pertenue str. Gauthier]AEZ60708.1 hypothetical protein TPADAL_0385 [Treponem